MKRISLPPKERALHERALNLSRRHREVEIRLVETLEEIDRLKFFRKLGYSSLFIYATDALGLSETTAYSFITVSRKAREVVLLKQSLWEQKLTVHKASRIVSVLTNETAQELIAFAASHTTREIDQEVARRSQGTGATERKQILKIAPGVLNMLKRAQSLLSSQKRTPVDIESALSIVLGEYLDRHDPVNKAQRKSVGTETPQLSPSTKNSVQTEFSARKPLKSREKHAVFRRDKGRCTFVDANGKRCSNDRWVHIHHLQPVHMGGTNDPENLITLCSFHHGLVHREEPLRHEEVKWLRPPENSYNT